MDKSRLALKVIAGLTAGGLSGYQNARGMRQKAAIEALKAQPEPLRAIQSIYGNTDGLTPDQKWAKTVEYKGASSPYV